MLSTLSVYLFFSNSNMKKEEEGGNYVKGKKREALFSLSLSLASPLLVSLARGSEKVQREIKYEAILSLSLLFLYPRSSTVAPARKEGQAPTASCLPLAFLPSPSNTCQ